MGWAWTCAPARRRGGSTDALASVKHGMTTGDQRRGNANPDDACPSAASPCRLSVSVCRRSDDVMRLRDGNPDPRLVHFGADRVGPAAGLVRGLAIAGHALRAVLWPGCGADRGAQPACRDALRLCLPCRDADGAGAGRAAGSARGVCDRHFDGPGALIGYRDAQSFGERPHAGGAFDDGAVDFPDDRGYRAHVRGADRSRDFCSTWDRSRLCGGPGILCDRPGLHAARFAAAGR